MLEKKRPLNILISSRSRRASSRGIIFYFCRTGPPYHTHSRAPAIAEDLAHLLCCDESGCVYMARSCGDQRSSWERVVAAALEDVPSEDEEVGDDLVNQDPQEVILQVNAPFEGLELEVGPYPI